MAEFSCLDLHDRGLSLLPPSDAQFAPLVEDIRRRTAQPNPSGPPIQPEPIPENLEFAAILLNHSEKPIAGLALDWRFEDLTGRRYNQSAVNSFGRHLLLPFGLPPDRLALSGYWNTILPGSKRLLASGQIYGDNTDVRPPQAAEIWRGGVISGRNFGGASNSPAPRSVVLVLDGAFFADGEFIGPNQMHLWEDVYYEAEVKLEAARIASAAKAAGRTAEAIVAEVERFAGPAAARGQMQPLVATRGTPTPDDFRKWSRSRLAEQIQFLRQRQGDEAVVNLLVPWLDTPHPQSRRA